MPLVRIEVMGKRSRAYKQALLQSVHDALVEVFKIPESDRIQRVIELSPQDCERKAGDSDRFTLVELTVFPGRTAKAKEKLYATIVRNLERAPGVPRSEVMIVLHEVPKGDWGIWGGRSGAKVELGFKLKV